MPLGVCSTTLLSLLLSHCAKRSILLSFIGFFSFFFFREREKRTYDDVYSPNYSIDVIHKKDAVVRAKRFESIA
ncbi:hypothetical protein OAV88_01655 [bacterium]|nr:hypothetical protein [bacterium]